MLCRKRHNFYQALRASWRQNHLSAQNITGIKSQITSNSWMPGLRPEAIFWKTRHQLPGTP